jgi:RimJ/RimL family protein N-acetyltransferase
MDDIRLRPWDDDDLATLQRANTPAMAVHLGGPETDAALRERHARYLRLNASGEAHMFRVTTAEHPEGVGSIGYWHDKHRGERTCEAGWSIESAYQGRGYATAALRALIEHARSAGEWAAMYAYPRVDNEPSNAICRRTGFVLLGTEPFEYPKGTWATSNVFRLALEDEEGEDG